MLSPIYYCLAAFGKVRNERLFFIEKGYMVLSVLLLLLGLFISYVGTVFSLTLVDENHNALAALKKIITVQIVVSVLMILLVSILGIFLAR